MKLLWDAIKENKRNSVILVTFFVVFTVAAILFIERFIEYLYGTFIGIVFLLVSLTATFFYVLNAYYNGDRIILKMVKAIPLDESDLPDHKKAFIRNTVESLSIAAGIPAPKIYVAPAEDINAFATGRDPKHASICLTSGAIEKLNREELEGVIGHELGHISNYDTRYLMLTSFLLASLITLTNFGLRFVWFRDRREGSVLVLIGFLSAILAPLFAKIIQAAISRQREFLADATSVKLTRYPQGLINALLKIKAENKGMNVPAMTTHLWIANPLPKFSKLFATHPPIEERVRRLREMI